MIDIPNELSNVIAHFFVFEGCLKYVPNNRYISQ